MLNWKGVLVFIETLDLGRFLGSYMKGEKDICLSLLSQLQQQPKDLARLHSEIDPNSQESNDTRPEKKGRYSHSDLNV